ncbi:MAG: NACHT domain-containing protein [Terriglobia bacterium]
MARQVQDAAGAASQSLTRFLLNQQLSADDVARLLNGFGALHHLLRAEEVANPNIPPENVVNELLPKLPCPIDVKGAGKEAVYRLALYSVVQVLMLVGPVMAEWQKLNFAGTFEPSRRIINKLNQMSEQLGALGASGQAAADERYDLIYRDYLLQRFHRIEAGTVRMTTNQDVSLAELFVMPVVLPRPSEPGADVAGQSSKQDFMNLDAARRRFAATEEVAPAASQKRGKAALDQVKAQPRNVIIGAPGGGKSTFLEWLQLKLAGGEEQLVMSDQQAIPVLLRVRQLNPKELPRGARLIEGATGSKDIAALMPAGWIERQMRRGRVFFMVDGLDEVEPELRDTELLPWFLEVCREYPECRYLVSSRPEAYPDGTLRKNKFVECDLLDFNESQVLGYTRHWCTAVRLARNEPEAEAQREGAADGNRIVEGFTQHAYTRNLARNPLMLSAICLVNYFEGGQLPKDRAVLYRLCVEGLLHNWDQRRGIRSEFGFDEKLRACREVAVTMQADDRAEYEAPKVQAIFSAVLGEPVRAQRLLEHIRRRTGLLLERRPGVFAFAHLTFQEYLAARAAHEGNRAGVDITRLAAEHDDGRWREVIALFCGLAPAPSARQMIETLAGCRDSVSLGDVLAEAYLSGGVELSQDAALRARVIKRIAAAPGAQWPPALERFPSGEVAPIANALVGNSPSAIATCAAHRWLAAHPGSLEETALLARLLQWQKLTPNQMSELIHLLHKDGSEECLTKLSGAPEIYSAAGPSFHHPGQHVRYTTQAEIAVIGLSQQLGIDVGHDRHGQPATGPDDQADKVSEVGSAFFEALLQALRALCNNEDLEWNIEVDQRLVYLMQQSATWDGALRKHLNGTLLRHLIDVARRLAARVSAAARPQKVGRKSPEVAAALNSWADMLERRLS